MAYYFVMGKITDLQLRNWIKAGKALAKSDGDGLTFTLSPAGTAAWVLRYSFGGKKKELSLGRYPSIDLETARRLAEIERARIAAGRDVAAEKRDRKRGAKSAERIEALRQEIAGLESDLRRLRLAIESTKVRLSAARDALRIESEGDEA